MFRSKEVATLIKRCNDFGAGGVSVAIGELADGLEINLDLVPKKYEGLDGTELAISESQERMAVVVDAEKEAEFIKYADEENLEATTVARSHRRQTASRCTGEASASSICTRDFLNTNGAQQFAEGSSKPTAQGLAASGSCDAAIAPQDIFTETKTKEQLLEDLNCCSKKGLIERFDSTIGAGYSAHAAGR